MNSSGYNLLMYKMAERQRIYDSIEMMRQINNGTYGDPIRSKSLYDRDRDRYDYDENCKKIWRCGCNTVFLPPPQTSIKHQVYKGFTEHDTHDVWDFLRYTFELRQYELAIERFYNPRRAKIRNHPVMLKGLRENMFIIRRAASIRERRLVWDIAPRSIIWKSHSDVPKALQDATFVIRVSEYEKPSREKFRYMYYIWDDPSSVYVSDERDNLNEWIRSRSDDGICLNEVLELWKILSGDQFEQSGWSKLKGEY